MDPNTSRTTPPPASLPGSDDTGPPSAAEFPTGDWGITPGTPGSLPLRTVAVGDVFGPYELLGEIARGGMGVVYKARQRGLDRVVALKMVLGSDLGRAGAAQRFIQEAKAAAALDHPNVVPVYDTGEADGRVYFTMAFVDGPDLKGYVDANGVPPLAKALTLFVQVVAGVAHAHKHGVVHRDLKPANVLIDKDGRPRVTDFGLAKRAAGDSQLTGTGQIMGTPAYMPPEQARGAKDVGPAADVYSLGAVLYYLLTGRPPFVGETITDLLLQLISDPPAPPSTLNAAVPLGVEVVCLRCLAKDPADRYADAQALLDVVMAVAEEHLPRSAPRLSSISRWPDARPALGDPPTQSASAAQGTVTGPVPVPASAAASRRAGWWPWVGVAAVLLVAVGLVFVVRPWVKPPASSTTGSNPSAATNGRPAADAVTWPAPTRGDFGLTVDLVARADKDDRGVHLMADKAPLEIRLRADRDCNAVVWSIDPAGQVVQLFPNEFDRDGRLTGGRTRVVPGDKNYALETTPTAGDGAERLRVIATTGDLPPLPGGEKNGAFTVFNTEAERRSVVAVRGVIAKKADADSRPAGAVRSAGLVAETELLYRVVPR